MFSPGFHLFYFSSGCTECVILEPPSRTEVQAVFVPAASWGQEITHTSVCRSAPVSNMHTVEGWHIRNLWHLMQCNDFGLTGIVITEHVVINGDKVEFLFLSIRLQRATWWAQAGKYLCLIKAKNSNISDLDSWFSKYFYAFIAAWRGVEVQL